MTDAAAVKSFVRIFLDVFRVPLSLGIYDFCRLSSEGDTVSDADLCFPFAIVLRPCTDACLNVPRSHCDDTFEDCFDEVLDSALHIPCRAVLYDVLDCPEPQDVPHSYTLQRIGRMATSSAMIQSSPRDGLFFRHRDALSADVTINQGQTKGTIGKLADWQLFEQHIEDRLYIDYEQPQP